VPVPMCYQLAFDAALRRAVLRVFLRTVFGWQRRRAARRGLVGARSGSITAIPLRVCDGQPARALRDAGPFRPNPRAIGGHAPARDDLTGADVPYRGWVTTRRTLNNSTFKDSINFLIGKSPCADPDIEAGPEGPRRHEQTSAA